MGEQGSRLRNALNGWQMHWSGGKDPFRGIRRSGFGGLC